MFSLNDSYRNISHSLRLYWNTYGGLEALTSSPYLHFSIFITFICYPFSPDASWYKLILSIIPNLLGFTLGGYAILLAFGDELFRKIISGKGPEGEQSPFMRVNGAFIHFIVVQVISILVAILGHSYQIKGGVIGLFGFLLLIYSLLTAAAAAFAILNVANWFDEYSHRKNKCPKKDYTE